MKVTIRQKITFGVLGLAAIAFVADRMTSAPAHASAGTIARAAASAGPATTRRPLPATAAVAVNEPAGLASFAIQLRDASARSEVDAEHANDAFSPSGQWTPAVQKNTDAAEQLAAADHFRQHHKLLAIMLTSRGGMALLDGKPVRPGQTVDGFRLAEVHEREAVFEAGQSRIRLTVAAPAGAPASDNLVIRPARSGETW